MIQLPNKGNPRVAEGYAYYRLVAFADAMPALLDLCDIPLPDTVDGMSMVGADTREYLYSECIDDRGCGARCKSGTWEKTSI